MLIHILVERRRKQLLTCACTVRYALGAVMVWNDGTGSGGFLALALVCFLAGINSEPGLRGRMVHAVVYVGPI